MTTKPPFGLAASGQPNGSDSEHLEDLSDEIDVDSSHDVTVEASEESTLEIEDEASLSPSETPPPVSAFRPHGAPSGTPPPRRAPTLMGLPLPSLPLPGVTASRPASRDVDDEGDDMTVMARPSITDDEEEATKVEPAETAIRAAASRDDDDELTTALSAQASQERDKALRKTAPPSLDLPLPSPHYRADQSDEFEDPEDGDLEVAHDTPNAITVHDEELGPSSFSDQDEPSSELEAVLAPRRPAGSPPLGSAFGRSDGFGAARLPTPGPGYGFSLPSPTQAPAPSNSPFSARIAPVGSPYGARSTSAPMPAIQIPAPSGAAASASGSSGIFYKVQVPVVGLAALLIAAGGGGLLFGAKLWRSGATATATAQTAPTPVAAPTVVQQALPPAAAPAAATTAPAPASSTPTAAPVAAPAPTAAPAVAPIIEQAQAPASPPPKHVAAHPAVRKAPVAGASAPASPAPARSRPAKSPKVAKGWVDPFAE
jgi:hypothetical protein